ncbi:MAG TPA: hypothetical protein PK014_01870 [Thermoanaerobaculia bacterium]|nr:hypothetical protein [Thermoanaerobaculia bacterium]HUM28560.1 hypothetical protein [Thermoanaerobaculia bacterium]HXK66832.1 hypothetical protein [Thermoanaerobaculia bacterium]
MRRFTTGLVAILALIALVSCSNLSDVEKAKAEGKGESEIYPVTVDQAWEISLKVLRWEGSDAIEEHKSEGYMLTSTGMNLVSYGAVMGVWVEKVDKTSTKVTFVTKRRLKTDVFTTTTHKRFHELFAKAVQLVKDGQPLPLKAPN